MTWCLCKKTKFATIMIILAPKNREMQISYWLKIDDVVLCTDPY